MHCPKCGDVLVERNGLLTCVRGEMPLSKEMAQQLRAHFVGTSDRPKEFCFDRDQRRWGGRWFCPSCGLLMSEEVPGEVRCPGCARNLGAFIGQLIELHPHRPVEAKS